MRGRQIRDPKSKDLLATASLRRGGHEIRCQLEREARARNRTSAFVESRSPAIRVLTCLGAGVPLVAACLAGCGTADTGPSIAPIPAAAAFGEPLATQPCDRTYQNGNFGFGFEPPPETSGPQAIGSDDEKTLFSAIWRTPTGRTFEVAVTNVGTTAFEEAINRIRRGVGEAGLQLLDDRPIALNSGRVGWLLITGSDGGQTHSSVYDVRRGFLFSMRVDVSGVTTSELESVEQVLASFCVEP